MTTTEPVARKSRRKAHPKLPGTYKPGPKPKQSRIHTVLQMRKEGKTWQEIGDRLGVTRQRAHAIWAQHLKGDLESFVYRMPSDLAGRLKNRFAHTRRPKSQFLPWLWDVLDQWLVTPQPPLAGKQALSRKGDNRQLAGENNVAAKG